MTQTRAFETGATRDSDDSKLDYEGFISPIVLERYAQYMHECRLRNVPAGQSIRSSDNWQKGMPINSYMKSMLRHVFDVWKMHRQSAFVTNEMLDALSATLFNVQGYMFELLKVNHARLGQSSSGQPVMSEMPNSQSFDAQI